MSQFGLEPFGPSPLGGPGLIEVQGIIASSVNELIAVFSEIPLSDDPEGFGSATNARNWTLVTIDPTVTAIDGTDVTPAGEGIPTYEPTIVGAFVDAGDPKQIRLRTDARLENRVLYDLTINGQVRGDDCEVLSGDLTHQIRGPRRGRPLVPRFIQEDRFRDWDNSLFPTDPNQPSGTWKITEHGDIGLHDEAASLRKRIWRRITASSGAFTYLRGYGVGIDIKAIARPGNVQSLMNEIARQCRLEPDVADAGAFGELDESAEGVSILRITVAVRRLEQRDTRLIFEVPTRV